VIPQLAPNFEAALRDVRAQQARFRAAAAARLADPPADRHDEAVRGLLLLAEDTEGAVREAAFEALGILEARVSAALLLDAFDDEHPGARQAAVLALGRVAPDRSRGALTSLLEDSRPEMRFAAVWTLATLGADHASAIAGATRDADAEVRLLAAQCLGDLGASAHCDRLAHLLEDEFDGVRFAAATALAALGDSRGAPTLRAGLGRADRAFSAAIGLGDLEDQHSRLELARLAKHPWRSPILRAAAARALVKLGDPEGPAVIRKLVRSWRIEARQYAVQLVGELRLTSLMPDLMLAFRRSRPAERPVYETALQQLAPESAEARALLASLRATDHAV
jgi:HEAT repeat protein